jgi:Alw26I/Eco31I/Esp3I family type II restriction m6 adenine DNA methyltransferase
MKRAFPDRISTFPEFGDGNAKSAIALWKELYQAQPDLQPFFEEILDSMTICDPACGDGSFLLTAADMVFNIRTELFGNQEITTDPEIRSRIIRNNLFGVDIVPETVDRCIDRLKQWAHYPPGLEDEFNTILYKHIKCGNSLIDHPPSTESTDFDLNPFDWAQNFPEIMARGGFDIILGNPPWNAVKPFEKEFFMRYHPKLTRYGADKIESRTIIRQLLGQPEIKSLWEEYANLIRIESQIFKNQFRYQTAPILGKRTSGDLNYYKLFLERAHALTHPEGFIGFIVPSGFYSDAGAKGLRELYFDHGRVHWIINFENRRGIFPDVHRSFKFILLVAEKSGPTQQFHAQFMLHDPAILQNGDLKSLTLNWPLMKRFSPESYSVIECRTPMDGQILTKILDRHPLLLENHPTIGTVKFKREFDISLDSRYFRAPTPANLQAGLPLWEGKMIEQFTPYFSRDLRYCVSQADVAAKLGKDQNLKPEYTEYRLAFRAVAASTNRRSMIATILPPNVVCGNSLITLQNFDQKQEILSLDQRLYLCAVFNSAVFDYLLRLKINTNLNMFFIYQMPVPIPSPEIRPQVVRDVVRLTEDWADFAALRTDYHQQDLSITEPQRIRILAEIDRLVGQAYGLSRDEMTYILGTFHHHDKKTELYLRKFELLVLDQYN